MNHNKRQQNSKKFHYVYQNYYSGFIQPNIHKIQSLYLSNSFMIDFFSLTTQNICKFLQLQTLLGNIQSQQLENLLIGLTYFSKCSSLTIHIIDDTNLTNIFNLIFQVPLLRC
ncbi:unnamed protein product [Adineta steineri]|uniref:Uncharacterized protein n=1 Tax=Adineta steineri TaxID=433720 RepID=A0A813Q1L1_9BILA|nr:unnamed protein product [Adineta steineri]CAF0796368.1 unnamed protein product [Adineta steineri]